MKLQYLVLVSALCASLAGCSTAHYRKAADNEVYDILSAAAKGQLDMLKSTNDFAKNSLQRLAGKGFDIAPTNSAWASSNTNATKDPYRIRAEAIISNRLQDGTRLLTLPDALLLAEINNRGYQLKRESVYLAALTLTRTRNQFELIPTGSVEGGITRNSDGSVTKTGNTSLGFSKLFRAGGKLTADLANDLALYLDGTPKVPSLTLKLTQPLLRGAGAAVAAEVLTQSERDVVYEIRDYTHYQSTFSLDIIERYYRLLQQKDSVRNAYDNYLRLIQLRELAEALQEAERVPEYQVDQARQDEYQARLQYIAAIESYQTSIDGFKQQLALPQGEKLALDDTALTNLVNAAMNPIQIEELDAFKIARRQRLDLLNEIDKFEDSQRKLRVAENKLKPDLTFVTDVSLSDMTYDDFKLNNYTITPKLKLDLPFDRVDERNAYRTALINFEKQIRTLATAFDTLRETLRKDLRVAERGRQDYSLQKNALDIARRRVENLPLLFQAGRSTVRDQLEAQSAYVRAQNGVTKSLIDFHLSRLNVQKDIGALNTTTTDSWLLPSLGQPVPPNAGNTLPVVPPDEIFKK
ncbi:MAG: TolC family protein [Pedosphaera sp.]|nr:TolC family protein [Pedosphaera sp.]